MRGRKTDIQACQTLTENAATCINRMQKALTQMNLKLQDVLNDITGVTRPGDGAGHPGRGARPASTGSPPSPRLHGQ
ncbi:MAG: hypothetical protein JO266_15600 [Acidobacteria bacterium]|nr:hypothetical protein [Acidobacteriota bacterium]